MRVKSQKHKQTNKATLFIFFVIKVLFLLVRDIKKGKKRESERRKESDHNCANMYIIIITSCVRDRWTDGRQRVVR